MFSNPKWRPKKIRKHPNRLMHMTVPRGLLALVSDVANTEIVKSELLGFTSSDGGSRWYQAMETYSPNDVAQTNFLDAKNKPWIDIHINWNQEISNLNNFPITVGSWYVRWKRDVYVTDIDTSVRAFAAMIKLWIPNDQTVDPEDHVFKDDSFDPRNIPQISDYCSIEYKGHGVIRPGETVCVLNKNLRQLISLANAQEAKETVDGLTGVLLTGNMVGRGEFTHFWHVMPSPVSGSTNSGYPNATILLRNITREKHFIGLNENALGWSPTFDEPSAAGFSANSVFSLSTAGTNNVVTGNNDVIP